MFDSEPYLNAKMLSAILSEFKWPHAYYLEDDLPDGIIVSFPKSNFAFCEGTSGGILVRFLPEDVQGRPGLHIGHAVLVFVPLSQRSTVSITPGLIDIEGLPPSEEKLKNAIRNACKIILTHLRTVIDGDFSWVDEYLKIRAKSGQLST